MEKTKPWRGLLILPGWFPGQVAVMTGFLGLAEHDESVLAGAIGTQSTQTRKWLSCWHKGTRGELEEWLRNGQG